MCADSRKLMGFSQSKEKFYPHPETLGATELGRSEGQGPSGQLRESGAGGDAARIGCVPGGSRDYRDRRRRRCDRSCCRGPKARTAPHRTRFPERGARANPGAQRSARAQGQPDRASHGGVPLEEGRDGKASRAHRENRAPALRTVQGRFSSRASSKSSTTSTVPSTRSRKASTPIPSSRASCSSVRDSYNFSRPKDSRKSSSAVSRSIQCTAKPPSWKTFLMRLRMASSSKSSNQATC